MSYLKCKHCGVTYSYADANIADIRGEKCSENTTEKRVDGGVYTVKDNHEWKEIQ